MIRTGFTIENPITQSRTVVVTSDQETNGMGWSIESYCVPKAGPDIAEHLHLTWTETFEIIAGTAHYSVDGKQQLAQAGDTFVVLPQQRHIHPWNAGESTLIYRQTDQFEAAAPEAIQDVLGTFATMAGLAREGKINQKGLPKNPLQLAATMRTLGKHGNYDAALPIPVQQLLGATLGRLAEALGYRAVYPQYVNHNGNKT